MNTMFGELRLRGGRAARVIDPASEHGCDNSRLLVIPFFDAVLAAARNAEELRFSSFVDDTVEPGESPVYGLTFLDAAGNESPPGLARIRE